MKVEHRFSFFIFQLSEKWMTLIYTHWDAAPESYEVRPESLESFEPSYASRKVKNENDAIRNRIFDFDKRRISQPKTQ